MLTLGRSTERPRAGHAKRMLVKNPSTFVYRLPTAVVRGTDFS